MTGAIKKTTSKKNLKIEQSSKNENKKFPTSSTLFSLSFIALVYLCLDSPFPSSYSVPSESRWAIILSDFGIIISSPYLNQEWGMRQIIRSHYYIPTPDFQTLPSTGLPIITSWARKILSL